MLIKSIVASQRIEMKLITELKKGRTIYMNTNIYPKRAFSL